MLKKCKFDTENKQDYISSPVSLPRKFDHKILTPKNSPNLDGPKMFTAIKIAPKKMLT